MKMNGEEAGRGVQVVRVGANHSYHLDEPALEQILLRDDVKDLPVVVVSVAGAYRGGKSFLLDFFLRYLHSPLSNQKDGKWLGEPDEPLKGFSWCGGSERNTTGMLLWSEPMQVSLPSGERVVVLLIDTQGTFDSRSTIRDCSTIFALSTLLSSVQIYNLSQNIREDDLQHLQLFSEYGRLASNEEEKPFQVLQFLVRDWAFPYEHPFGACGGNKLLQKRLQIEEDQAHELRELREHISSCFDEVTCFLMPHPGFAVSNPNFNGRPSDIREEFKESLLELVPSIFAPSKLKPKMINGQRVKAKEFFTYFKTYMNIFNSDELPAPVSILKATSEAGMLTGMMAAREQYELEMDRSCGEGQPSVPSAELRQQHHAALAAAATAFSTKKKMGSQQDADAYLERLIQELDSRLPQYLALNEVKTQRALANSVKAYEDLLYNVTKEQPLCLHPQDLEEFHLETVAAAMALFDSNRTSLEEQNDEHRSSLLQDFEKRLIQLRGMNEQNNVTAVTQACDEYKAYMQTLIAGSCISTRSLNAKHEQGRDAALDSFKCKRNRFTEYPEDNYVSQVLQNIAEHLRTLELMNVSNTNTAKQTAVYGYNNYMASIWGPQTSYLQPDDLRHKHEGALERALVEFRSCWTQGDSDDGEENKLREVLNGRYEELRNVNEARKPAPENRRGERKWQRILRLLFNL